MQWKTRKRSDGLRLAGPCLDGSAAHPATSADRTNNAGAFARRPQQSILAANLGERPASCERNGNAHPE